MSRTRACSTSNHAVVYQPRWRQSSLGPVSQSCPVFALATAHSSRGPPPSRPPSVTGSAGPGKGEASDDDDNERSSSNVSGFNSEMGSDDQSLNEEPLAANQESPSQDLVPVNFNEPISMLQRLSEDLEYHELLDKAAMCQSSLEQLCYVAAFSVSSYSTTVHRTGKPFNPLLGETYELDRARESGYRSLCEQVSHHPPAAAHHVISSRGWTLRQEITVASKFRGKYLSIMPLGTIHAIFEKGNHHYTWKKVTTT
ncbi:hypothetical protein CRUP_038494, partial [Coryphaenoides rupestris]